MFSVVGVRAPVQEPDRRAILRLAHHLSESTLLYRNFKEKPQQTKVSSERQARLWKGGPSKAPRMNSPNELLPPRYRDPDADRLRRHGRDLPSRGLRARTGRRDQGARRAVRARSVAPPTVHARGAGRGAALGRSEHGHDLRRRRVAGAAVHRHGVPGRRLARGPAARGAAFDATRRWTGSRRLPPRSTRRTARASSTAT